MTIDHTVKKLKALTEAKCRQDDVEDVGLSLSPMVYFAWLNLNSDAIAMVTVSHNENGWIRVKMGIKKGLTHAPEEMSELKDLTLTTNSIQAKGILKKLITLKRYI